MTLYISLPVLASACSMVMIAHFVLLAEGRIPTDGHYGDMYTYIDLAESFDFFGSSIPSFRIIVPLISGTIAGIFSLSGTDSLGLLTGSLNFIYLLIGFGWMYYLSLKEITTNSLEVALPTFLLISLPGFWQGVFLPVPDALMFCMFGLILTGVLRQHMAILLPAIIAGVWVSEWLFLAVLLLPLVDHLRGTYWIRGYSAFAAAALIYLAVPLFTTIPDPHLVFRPGAWFAMASEQFSTRDTSLLYAFWRSFTFTLPFFAYRFYVMGWNRITGALAVWFVSVFLIVFLLAPDSANRIMFMVMPVLVLWQYTPDTFRMMERPIEREREEAVTT